LLAVQAMAAGKYLQNQVRFSSSGAELLAQEMGEDGLTRVRIAKAEPASALFLSPQPIALHYVTRLGSAVPWVVMLWNYHEMYGILIV